jgi:CAAX prenyl protease-like protein
MTALSKITGNRQRSRSLPYVLPFAVFLAFLGIKGWIPSGTEYPARVVVVTALLLLFSRHLVSLKTSRPLVSAAVGIGVFLIWIGPDLIWPAYREHWLFGNALMGRARSSLPQEVRVDFAFLVFRVAGTALLVPVIEELFWRAWLMRYLIAPHFESVRLGTYSALSFWITAALFASEHGPYWDVGLLAGVTFNWWMIRTRNLADCILAHAVTNACLAAYVLSTSQWQYWL